MEGPEIGHCEPVLRSSGAENGEKKKPFGAEEPCQKTRWRYVAASIG